MSNSPQSSSTTNISSLANSPSRVVIPLGPPPPTAAPVPDSSSFMLLDYLSRLARFEPRIRRYAASKLSEHREPVHAFSGTSGSTTPVVQTPRSGHSPAAGASPSGGTHSAHGFSLVDLERTLLSAAPKWWTKRGAGASAPGTPSHQHDSGGLDVDISSVFLRHTSSPSATNGGHEAPLLQKDAGPGLFLNYYTSDDLIALLTSTGVLSALAARGYSHPSLIFDTSDSFQHRLSLVDSALFDPKLNLLSSERFLVDLYMKRRRRWGTDAMVCYQLMQRVINAGGWEELREVTGEIRAPYVGLEGARESIAFFDKMVPKCSKTAKKGGGEWDVTEIAWMQMHDPLGKTTRPLLPGQRFPGLGLGRQIAAVMEGMATSSHVTDGLLNFPFHYHNATAYHVRGYRHLDPIYEAYVQWMTSQLESTTESHGFAFVSWAVSLGHLRRITEELPEGSTEWRKSSDRLERWSPSEQVFPTSESMSSFVGSEEWERLRGRWKAIFEENGGAEGEGVGVVKGEGGRPKRARLVIDLEGCPELWKYSKIWEKRDPETGKFRW